MNVIKKLNWTHLGLIIILPILLAIINPNWIFNLGFVDDYVYLGYQLDYPKYIGWYPSNSLYFVERLSFLLPGYFVRQIFEPVIANFIIHLALYYGLIFSIYGVLHKLFNTRVALVISLLSGQYPLIMRAVGWDYPDGYAVLYFTLSILFLTYSMQSPRRPLYLIGAGIAFLMMINAHFFNVFYAPSLALYLLFLEKDLYKKPIRLIKTGIYVFLGIIGSYLILALIYYQWTGNILFANSLTTAENSTDFLYNFLIYTFGHHPPNWHLFLGLVALMTIWQLLHTHKQPIAHNTIIGTPQQILRAITVLFISAYAVIIGWRLSGFLYTHVSYYHSNIIMTAFLVLGAIVSKSVTSLSLNQFRYLVFSAFFIPIIPFMIITFAQIEFTLVIYWALFFFSLMFAVILVFVKRTSIRIYAIIMFIIASSILIGHSRHIRIYSPERYGSQDLYEQTVEIAQLLNERYDSYSLDTFRFWYDINDPKHHEFRMITSIYLFAWGRWRYFTEPFVNDEFFASDNIIILSTADTETALLIPKGIFSRYLRVLDEVVVNDTRLIFTQIRVEIFGDNAFTYYPDPLLQPFILEESGWNGYESTTPLDKFRWTSEPTARLVFDAQEADFDAQKTYNVNLTVSSFLEDEVVNSLTLSVNGVQIDIVRDGNQFTGIIAGASLMADKLEFVIKTDRVSNPFDLGIQDGRKLGVAIGELVIEQMNE